MSVSGTSSVSVNQNLVRENSLKDERKRKRKKIALGSRIVVQPRNGAKVEAIVVNRMCNDKYFVRLVGNSVKIGICHIDEVLNE